MLLKFLKPQTLGLTRTESDALRHGFSKGAEGFIAMGGRGHPHFDVDTQSYFSLLSNYYANTFQLFLFLKPNRLLLFHFPQKFWSQHCLTALWLQKEEPKAKQNAAYSTLAMWKKEKGTNQPSLYTYKQGRSPWVQWVQSYNPSEKAETGGSQIQGQFG